MLDESPAVNLDFVDSSGRLKAKSSNRIFYDAQVEIIRRQLGDLEKIRLNLGLSQRKIAQLLLVDPSAWTRWTKKGDSAPPHIYRALQWYMVIQEKIPGISPQYFIGREVVKVDGGQKEALGELNRRIELLSIENEKLKEGIRANRMGFMMIVLAGVILGFAFYMRYLRNQVSL